MNNLRREKKIEVIAALCDGLGIRVGSRDHPRQPWHRGGAVQS
jgi:hypothetical protein